jgi:hypothetical protein
VGFRGGTYSDASGVLPLIGAATTELRGVHAPFLSDVFYPIRPWSVNYFDALDGGATNLMLTPAQFISESPDATTGVRRAFSAMSFRLYYSDHTSTHGGGSTPALAAAPSIVKVAGIPGSGNVTFQIKVTGNPAAGVQEVWVTFTNVTGSFPRTWQSLNLTQSAADSTLWTGVLNLGGASAQDIRYVVQAVNGVGLVAMDTNQGAYYIPGVETAPTTPTALAFIAPPTSGAYGTQASFTAELTSNGSPLAGQVLTFRLGPQTRHATTNASGRATVTLSLIGLPGATEAKVSFAGTSTYIASSATSAFTIVKQGTTITLDPAAASGHSDDDALMTATLTDLTGRRLGEKTLFFVISGAGGTHSAAIISDFAGRAVLGDVPLPAGTYNVAVYFSGNVPLPGESLTLDDLRYQPASATGSLTLLNNPPTANDDSAVTDENVAVTIAVLDNDDDVDGHTLSVASVTQGAHGSVTTDGATVTYTPAPGFSGVDTFTYVVSDGNGGTDTATVTVTVNDVNEPPVCSLAVASPITIWPPDKTFKPVSIINVTDPDGDVVTILITAIFQDERVGHGSSAPDGRILGPNSAEVRAERDGNGDGRVYHLFFTASDGLGGVCSGHVRSAIVPHDQGGTIDLIDGGPLYDSTVSD